MISSVKNERVKRIAALTKKPKERAAQGVFLAEGSKMFLEAPAGRIAELYVTPAFMDKCGFRDKIEQHSYELVTDEVFRKMADTQTPQGILCVVKREEFHIEDMLKKKAPLLLILEDIQDPGNLGTILRTGEGAGIDGVIMSRETVDVYNPKTIRSTMGSVYRVPFVYADSLEEIIIRLHRSHIHTYAAYLKGASDYDTPDYRGGTAFLIGNESSGLKEGTARLAMDTVKIPMQGRVESLNASVAASLLMYEAARQRRFPTLNR